MADYKIYSRPVTTWPQGQFVWQNGNFGAPIAFSNRHHKDFRITKAKIMAIFQMLTDRS